MRSGKAGFLGAFAAVAPLPSDPYWDNVVSLLRFQGADGSTDFIDDKGVEWTSNGAVISDDQSSVGTTSGYFNGSADITSAAVAELALGTADYTLEWVLRRSAGTAYQCFFDSRPSSAPGYGVYSAGAAPGGLYPCVAHNTNVFLFGTQQVPAATWTHVAVVRVSGSVTMFIGGVPAGTAADSRNLTGTIFRLGRSLGGIQPFTGYVQQFRATEAVARYTEPFTPPAGLFPTA